MTGDFNPHYGANDFKAIIRLSIVYFGDSMELAKLNAFAH